MILLTGPQIKINTNLYDIFETRTYFNYKYIQFSFQINVLYCHRESQGKNVWIVIKQKEKKNSFISNRAILRLCMQLSDLKLLLY